MVSCFMNYLISPLIVKQQIVKQLIVTCLLVSLLSSCASDKPQTVTLASTASLLDSLVWIANDQGYFKEQGLDLVFKVYPSGKRALLGMLDGKADIATTSDVPFMAQLHKHPNLRIVATLGSADNELKIVTRTDRGIKEPADLKGKTIATQQASAVHFFLYLYLLQQYLNQKDVNILFMKIEDLPAALAEGKIDAMSLREPFITKASELLNGQIQIFSAPGLYRKTYNLVTDKAYIKAHPDIIEKLLKALIKAEGFVEHNPDKAKQIIARLLKTDKESVDRLWSNFILKVVLDQDLLLQLQLQEKWLSHICGIDNDSLPLPLFESLHLDSLTHVAPERVGLKKISNESY